MCKGFATLAIDLSFGTNVSAFSANGGSGQLVYDFGKHPGTVHNGNTGGAQIDSTPYVQVPFGGAHLASSTQAHATVVTPNSPQKSSRIGNAGETACATIANQQFAAQVGQAFSLPGLLPRAANPGEPITARISANQSAFAMTIDKQVDNSQNNLRYTTGFNFVFGAQ